MFYTQDWHPRSTPHFEKDGGIWPVHCVIDSWGAEFHPHLRVEAYRPRWPLQYLLAGGLKWWSLIPSWSIPFARALDRALLALSPELGSFAAITVTRRA